MISIRCPASCGEIFQGTVKNQEALISYAIDLYSVVTLEKGKRRTGINQDKAYHAMEETLKYYNRSSNLLKDYRLIIESDIPRGKGMASSTADVAGAVMASAWMIDCYLTEEILGEIAAKVEPTDSTLFSTLSLFNGKSGERLKSYGPYPKGRVLILEGVGTVNTLDFHQKQREMINYRAHQKSGGLDHSEHCHHNKELEEEKGTGRDLEIWERNKKNLSLKEIGKIATISAKAHQIILPKPELDEIIKLSTEAGAFGVNTAHSGSVLGVLYDEAFFDKKKFISKIYKEGIIKYYPRIRDHQLIQGGLQWLK